MLPTYTGEYILHICKDLSLGPSKVQFVEVSFDGHVFFPVCFKLGVLGHTFIRLFVYRSFQCLTERCFV